jgi:hypothetical protein
MARRVVDFHDELAHWTAEIGEVGADRVLEQKSDLLGAGGA